MVQVFSGITARNFNRTIHASNPYSIAFGTDFFFFAGSRCINILPPTIQ